MRNKLKLDNLSVYHSLFSSSLSFVGDDLLHFEVGMSMQVKNSVFLKGDKGAKLKKKEVKLPLFSFVSVSAATNKLFRCK
jgi:hypothetical protein